MASARAGAHQLKLADERLIINELVPQVAPPSVVDSRSLEDLLDAAVVEGNQLGALACEELAGCDGADPAALGTWLDAR